MVSSASGELRLDALVQVALGLRVFDDRLDHQIRLRHAAAGQIAAQTCGHRGALGLVLYALAKQFAAARQGGIDEALFAVLQRDFKALVGRPRGDITAHHAGTDDMHVADGRQAGVLAAKGLEPLGQEEDADQIARCRRTGQLDHCLALGRQAGLDPAATGALPRGDQRIRRGIVFLAGLARDLLAHLRCQQLACKQGVGRPGGGALLERARGAGQCQRRSHIHQHRRCSNLVDQAHRPRSLGRHRAPGEHQVHCRRCPDQARQAGAAAPAGKDAELGFRQPDARAAIVGGHPVAAGQCNLGAAAHAEAMDGRHRGAGQFGQFLEHLLAAANCVVDGAAAVELLEFLQVGAGDEAIGLGRAQHHALGRIQCQAFDDIAQFEQHVLREGIDRRALAVEAEHEHAVLAQVYLPMAESEPVETWKHAVGHPAI